MQALLQVTIASSDTQNMIINAASDTCDKLTGRVLRSTAYVDEVYDGNGSCYIFLKQYPASAVSSVKRWDPVTATLLYTYTVNLEYILHEENAIYLYGGTLRGINLYKISYTAGYAITDVPWDLKKACAEIAGMLYRGKGKTGIESERIGAYSVTFKGNIPELGAIPVPPEVWAVLQMYRKHNV